MKSISQMKLYASTNQACNFYTPIEPVGVVKNSKEPLE